MAVTFEVCVDSAAGAAAARQGGAQRIELCSALLEGGVTPSAGLIELVVAQAGLPVMVMVRPRGGDFCYTASEVDVMRRDIDRIRSSGAAGVVLGVLRDDGSVDADLTGELASRARPLQVTFHRAIDMCRDPREALEALASLGIERVLTSGGERTALEGAERIRALVEQARGRIAVMAGGGITGRNAARIVRETGVREVHATARKTHESPMRFRQAGVFLGGELRPPEFSRVETDRERVAEILQALAEPR